MAGYYFKGDSTFAKVLRFFNLLEPGHMVLSISKIFMWLMIFAVVAIMLTAPENLAALLSSVGVTLISTGNYMYRRRLQSREDEKPEERTE